MIPFKSTLFLFEMYKDDKKLRNNIIIKNKLLKISASKILKLSISNISFVSSLLIITELLLLLNPLKNKNSDNKNFLLKENTVSSLPK